MSEWSNKCYQINTCLPIRWASLVAQLVKNPPAMQETPVWFLGWEDPMEKGMATQASILAWRIPRTVWNVVHGVPKSWTRWSDFHFHFPIRQAEGQTEISYPTLKPDFGLKKSETRRLHMWSLKWGRKRAVGDNVGYKMSPEWILKYSKKNFEKWRIKFLKNQMGPQIKVSFSTRELWKIDSWFWK